MATTAPTSGLSTSDKLYIAGGLLLFLGVVISLFIFRDLYQTQRWVVRDYFKKTKGHNIGIVVCSFAAIIGLIMITHVSTLSPLV